MRATLSSIRTRRSCVSNIALSILHCPTLWLLAFATGKLRPGGKAPNRVSARFTLPERRRNSMDGAAHLLFQSCRHRALRQLKLQQLLDLADLSALAPRA